MKWQGSLHKQKGNFRVLVENFVLMLLAGVLSVGIVDLLLIYKYLVKSG